MRKQHFILLGISVLIVVVYAIKTTTFSNLSPNTVYKEYQLKTSGAGESLDAWSFERSYPNGRLPSEKYLAAFKKEQQDNEVEIRSGDDSWASLGPENIAGRTLCLAFHPTDPDVIFAGSASGGLWKTKTQGIGRYAWEYVPTGFPVLGVSSILIQKDNPNVMYLGTGETYHTFGLAEPGIINRFTRGTYGLGILKTEDGGLTWSQILSFDNEALTSVNDLEMNPANPLEIFAATTQGTFRTLDGGLEWDKVHSVSPSVDIEWDPNNENILYVSTGNLNLNLDPNLSGLYKTFNKGASFTEMLDDGLLPAWSGNAKLTIDPSDSQTLWASIQVGWSNQDPTTPAGMYKSTDAGVNWTKINDVNVAFWQGWYSHDMAINPSDPNEIFYVGIDTWMSIDAGRNMFQVTDYRSWKFEKIPVEEPEGDDQYVHADIHGVYYHPLDHSKVFFATDGGVFATYNSGESFTTLNGGLQTSQFYANFATSTTDPNLAIGGAQDNSTYIYDGTDSWTRAIGGDGMSAAINPIDDNIVYASAQNLFLGRSNNRGQTFFFIIPPTAPNEVTAFAGPFELAPSSPNVVYAGRQNMYRSENHGDHWINVSSTPIDGTNLITKIAVSPKNPNLVFAATSPNPFNAVESPKLLRSIDGGSNWDIIGNTLPQRLIKDIEIDPLDDLKVYVVFSGFGSDHFASSFDGGDSWESIDLLPDVPTNTILIDHQNTDHIYVGNDLGVYFSPDAGLNWEAFSQGMPEATIVMDLSISEANRKIRMASHGRGIYERDLVYETPSSTSKSSLSSATLNLYPNPTNAVLNIEHSDLPKGPVQYEIYTLNGQLIKTETVNVPGQQDYTIDVSGLTPATYMLQLKQRESLVSSTFVKQ